MNRQSASQFTWVRTILLVLILSVPTMATALDQVGIYFDQNYQTYATSISEPNTVVTGYLVLNEPSAQYGVAGWELCVGLEGPATFLSWELEGQTINIETAPCFMVGIGNGPLLPEEQVLLATFTLLVQEPHPITLSVSPASHASIPGQMAYLTGDDPGQILPLGSVSGEPEVAWINQDLPVAEVNPPHLFFGEIPLGHTAEREVTVSNIGGGSLIVDVEFLEGSGGLTLLGNQGPHIIRGGETLTLPFRFTPTEITLYEGILTFDNPTVPNVMVRGYGREPIISWSVEPEVVFDQTNISETSVHELIIYNTGEGAFTIDPQVAADCTAFSVDNPTPHTLEPGTQFPVIVAFTPDVEGPINCELNLGSVVDPVNLSGTGFQPVMSYLFSSTQLIFPDVAVGMSTLRSLLLTNTGEGILFLDVGLAEPSSDFEIINGSGESALHPGERKTITVSFTASTIGEFNNEMVFNNPWLPNVPLIGSGVEDNYSCIVTPEILDFGSMIQGGSYSRYITVRNDGNVDLSLAPEAFCSDVTITPAEVILPPGHSQNFTVSYRPLEIGAWECAISMGQGPCSEVACFGMVNEGFAPDANMVGLFFDPEFNEPDAFISTVEVVSVYLVLMNATDPNGISGWECQLHISGNTFLGATQLMGQAVNIGTSPEFLVGLGDPLPWADDIHLATFELIVFDPSSETALFLLPLNEPSIPNEMAWLSADFNEIIPMVSHTGSPLVSYINPSGIVAVQAPAPEVVMQGSMVELTWDVADHSNRGYLVYRRGETGAAELLFEQPRTAEGGHFVYRDNPMGYAAGTTLHYSYAVVQDGVEVARSPETDIELSGVPMIATRLLPNVPNPFNPMTEVKFEMEKAGQVQISVYDVSGRLVKVLVNESLASGPHSRLWQGKDASGRQVPSGAYYLRMETRDHIDHHKIMLLK